MDNNKFFPEIKGNFGFGCMRLPMAEGKVSLKEFCEMADIFLDAGFNYFDTAHGYLDGQSEPAIRECVSKRYSREKFVLTDKLSTFHFNKNEEIFPLFEKQLRNAGVEYFDFYLMHAQDKRIYEKYKRLKAYETAYKLKEKGIIRHFGISFHDKADVLDMILTEHPEIEVVQIQLNYIDYEDASVESKKVYEVCEKHGKPAIAMEPVKGGSLVNLPPAADQILKELKGGSNASYALRFAASFPNMAMVISGMSDISQVKDNVSFMKDFKPINHKEKEAIKKVCEIFRSQNLIPCTGCRYCVLDNDCPKDIQIPDLFAALNANNAFHSWNTEYYYNNVLTVGHGKASDCIKCGKCENICPQHLEIRKLLTDVAKVFEN
ncbi:MAG: aldo/keto reductase [Clostridia bacterium]|nr:aldo/keto reductase [Clostridia bacterium]